MNCHEVSWNRHNYKGFYSVVFMALVDADCKFIWADIGSMGSAWNVQDSQCSWAKECVKNGNLGFLDTDPFAKLPKDNQDVP